MQQLQLNALHEENAALRNANAALQNANVALLEENAALRNANVALLEENQALPRPRVRPRDELTVIAAGDVAAMKHKKQKKLESSFPLASDPATLTEAPSTSTTLEGDATEV